jgi:uncharacterized membrane protein
MSHTISIIVLSSIGIFFDTTLGVSKYPILTLSLCAIVLLYEYVSPFIYKAR